MDIRRFASLCGRSWSLHALALIEGGMSARVSPVAHAAGASRTAMAASFARLEELGLLRRASGHGHPLRPEFKLTAAGHRAGRMAGKLLDDLRGADEARLVRTSWALPVVRQLDDVGQPFGALRSALAPITDRSLSLALKGLVQVDWVARDVLVDLQPPAVTYSPTRRGATIRDCLLRV